MLSEHTFAREEVFPSWFANAVGEILSTYASDFVLTYTGTTVTCPAASGDGAATIAIAGNWRWLEAPVTRAHPGGAAGNFDIFVTAAANDIVGTPNPYTDSTNRAFALAIVSHGSTPTIVAGVVDQFRLVGSCTWDGTRITSLTQTVGRPTAPSNDSPDPGDFKHSMQTADHGTNPAGGGSAWLLLNGLNRTVAAATYPGLYAAMGAPTLTGGNFTLPSPAGRVLVAAGSGGTDDHSRALTARTLGQIFGEEVHTLVAAESGTNGNGSTVAVETGSENAYHEHTAPANGFISYTGDPGLAQAFIGDNPGPSFPIGVNVTDGPETGTQNAFHQHAVPSTGLNARNADNAHENTQPSFVANLFIKT